MKVVSLNVHNHTKVTCQEKGRKSQHQLSQLFAIRRYSIYIEYVLGHF